MRYIPSWKWQTNVFQTSSGITLNFLPAAQNLYITQCRKNSKFNKINIASTFSALFARRNEVHYMLKSGVNAKNSFKAPAQFFGNCLLFCRIFCSLLLHLPETCDAKWWSPDLIYLFRWIPVTPAWISVHASGQVERWRLSRKYRQTKCHGWSRHRLREH